LRLVVSLGLLALVVLSNLDWTALGAVLLAASLPLLGAALFMRLFGILISAARWRAMLRFQGLRPPMGFLLDSYMVGSFFNVFLPTSFGGDVVRIMDLRRWSGAGGLSAASVFVERVLGITVLMIFALVAILVWPVSLEQRLPGVPVAVGLAVAGLATLVLALRTGLGERVLALLPGGRLADRVRGAWTGFRNGAGVLLRAGPALSTGLAWSVLLQAFVVVHYWIIGQALGIDIPLVDWFFLIPILILALMLPAINGVGVRETAAMVLFGAYGFPVEAAVAFGLVDVTFTLITGAIGGLRFAQRRRPAREQPLPV
jgi:uncharacterized protein (TIRG00374 family)